MVEHVFLFGTIKMTVKQNNGGEPLAENKGKHDKMQTLGEVVQTFWSLHSEFMWSTPASGTTHRLHTQIQSGF